MRSTNFNVLLLIALLLLFPSSSSAVEWRWDTSNTLLNPSQVNIIPPASPFLFDIDSDGDKDLIVGQGNGTILLLYNDGFPDNIVWRKDSLYFDGIHFEYPISANIGDIDNDDSLEIVTSPFEVYLAGLDSIRVFRNIGSASNPIWSERHDIINIYTQPDQYFDNVRMADWDNDGYLDLFVRIQDNKYQYYRNIELNSRRSWEFDSVITSSLPSSNQFSGGGTGIDIADFNADGNSDVVISVLGADGPPSTLILLNYGSNESPVFQDYGNTDIYYPTMENFTTPIACDIDNNGLVDLFIGGGEPHIYFLKNNGSNQSPLFNGIGNKEIGAPYFSGMGSIAFLDKDVDGILDLAMTYIYYVEPDGGWCTDFAGFHNGSANTRPEYIWELWFQPEWRPWTGGTLSSGDMNNDGFPDILYSWGNIKLWLNSPDTMFREINGYFSGINAVGPISNAEPINFDADSDLDIVLRNSNERSLMAFENTGTPQNPIWTSRPDWLEGVNPQSGYPRACDLNNDGKIDLVILIGNRLQAFLNVGTSFQPSFQYDSTVFADLQNIIIYDYDVADLDGDGKDDIILNNNRSLFFIDNESITSISDEPSLPERSFISNCYPNPFNNSTNIKFSLSKSSHVKIEVFDITGAHVASIYDGILNAGENIIRWDSNDNSGSNVASGVYFYRLSADNNSETRKMVLLK